MNISTKKNKPVVRAAGCFMEYQKKVLLLQRSNGQSQGGKWGLPAGRIETGETPRLAVTREVLEETGFKIPPKKLRFLRKIVFNFPTKITNFFVFHVKLDSRIKILLDPIDHQKYAWVDMKNCGDRDDLLDGVSVTFQKSGL